jgi:hypothetical protein
MTLPPQITFRNMEPVADLETGIVKEISVLERFFKRIISCRIMIEGPRGRRYGGLYKVRIDLGVPNEELVLNIAPACTGPFRMSRLPARRSNPSQTESTGMCTARSMTRFKRCAAACRIT